MTRTSAPVSQAGTSPLTGRLSTVISWSWLVKPSAKSVLAVASVVAIVHNVPSRLD